VIETSPEPADPTLVRLVGSSVPFRAVSRIGDRIVAAWQSSAIAAVVSTWCAIPLDRRVRLVSVTVTVAVMTHVALTRFRAPEPTWWARAAWVVLALTAVVVGIRSRGVAAAWTDWIRRRTSQNSGNA
jgi:hypothetical protein